MATRQHSKHFVLFHYTHFFVNSFLAKSAVSLILEIDQQGMINVSRHYPSEFDFVLLMLRSDSTEDSLGVERFSEGSSSKLNATLDSSNS